MSLWAPHTERSMTISNQGPFWSCLVSLSESSHQGYLLYEALLAPLERSSWSLD